LISKGKSRNKAVIAVARELVGFMWDIAVNVEKKLGVALAA